MPDLTTSQLTLLLAIYCEWESELAGTVMYDRDLAVLLNRGLAKPAGLDSPQHVPTDLGEASVMALHKVATSSVAEKPNTEKHRPEVPILPAIEKHPVFGATQISDERAAYMVANAVCRQQDVRPEPALLCPPVTVYGDEARANARAIELAVHDRGTNFMVFKVVSVYRVDEIAPTRRF